MNNTSFNLKVQIVVLALIIAFPFLLNGQNAIVTEGYETIKTYPFSDPNPLPAMAIKNLVSRFYPYFMYDGYSDKGVDKNWKVVKMENEFISVTVLPEVGGKVMGAIENSTGYEFVYLNHVMKFRAIGLRGPWTSGGIEHNFGLDLGHAPWAAAPVDYILLKNPDGSVTCVVGGLDLASRSEWRVKINLPKDKAYFETEALWFNPLSLNQSYLSWENAAFKAADDAKYYFAGHSHIGHDGSVGPWPIDNTGRDISVYKNNNFGHYKSYHVIGDYRNWFGGYYENSSFGFGHWSLYSDGPGKKLWIWGLSREGAIWDKLLTDNDGMYVEGQSGVKFNQAAERSGYHSPFRQLSHRPFYAETKTDYWFPVKETGGMVDANVYGTLNVASKDSLHVIVSPLQKMEDSLVICLNGNKIFGEKVQFRPMKTVSYSFDINVLNNDTLTVNVGNRKLYYSTKPVSIITRPIITGREITDFKSAERLFRLAEDQNAMRNFSEAMLLYKKCLDSEPTHSKALSRIAELCYRSGQYEEGLSYARKVLEYSAYDGEANFIYGVILSRLNNLVEAAEAFSIASFTMEFRSAAFVNIAAIELKRKNFEGAVVYAIKSLDFNRYNLTAYNILISAYRKSGFLSSAKMKIDELIKIDPLNHYARFENYLINRDTAEFKSLIRNEFPHETYLELAVQYANTGLNEEAIQVLELAPSFPTVYYWLAYLNRNISSQKSDAYLDAAEAISPLMVFPFRPETIVTLEWALKKHYSWKTVYYLALIHWNNNNISKAKELFAKCSNEPDFASFYISRGILFSTDQAKKNDVKGDFLKALSMNPEEWRTWHELSVFYESERDFTKQFENAKKSYKLFPSNPIISIDYSKALLNINKPGESIEILNTSLILPQEGAQEGHEIFEQANISQALIYIEQKKFKAAVKSLEQAKLYPENLGTGKPYDPDYRLQDYLLAFCEREMGNIQKSMNHYGNIIDFSSVADNFLSAQKAGNNYITLLVLNKYGKDQQSAELMKEWKSSLDSLILWNISGDKLPLLTEWVFLKYNGQTADAEVLENKIYGASNRQAALFMRALEITGDLKKYTQAYSTLQR